MARLGSRAILQPLQRERPNDMLPETLPGIRPVIAGFSWIEEGKVAGMRRPGSLNPLAEDLAKLRMAGVGAIVSLTEIALNEHHTDQADMMVCRVPIPDFHAPSLTDLNQIVRFIQQSLEDNRPVAVHCTAGLGRTGTVLACWLVSQGTSPGNAVFTISSKRPGSIETAEQEQTVFDYADSISDPSV
jgi:atypical dual specificity phosphatase